MPCSGPVSWERLTPSAAPWGAANPWGWGWSRVSGTGGKGPRAEAEPSCLPTVRSPPPSPGNLPSRQSGDGWLGDVPTDLWSSFAMPAAGLSLPSWWGLWVSRGHGAETRPAPVGNHDRWSGGPSTQQVARPLRPHLIPACVRGLLRDPCFSRALCSCTFGAVFPGDGLLLPVTEWCRASSVPGAAPGTGKSPRGFCLSG